MPLVPVFPAADYNLVPATVVQNGKPVPQEYRQGQFAVPAQRIKALEYSNPDPKLRNAFNIAASFSPEFHREVASPFVWDGTWVLWDEAGELGPGTLAAARPMDHVVLVSTRLKAENDYTIAPILAHEAYHIVFNDHLKRGDECYQAEIAAHTWESRVWMAVIRHALLEQIERTGAGTAIQVAAADQAVAAGNGTLAGRIYRTYGGQCGRP